MYEVKVKITGLKKTDIGKNRILYILPFPLTKLFQGSGKKQQPTSFQLSEQFNVK